jgi:RecA-family ATPase
MSDSAFYGEEDLAIDTPMSEPAAHERLLADAKRDVALALDGVPRLRALEAGARSLAIPVRHGFIPRCDVIDGLCEQAFNCGMYEEPGENVVIATIDRGLREGVEANGHAHADVTPPDGGWEPPTEIPIEFAPDPAPSAVALVNAADWPDEAPPAMSWLVRDKIPRGDVSTLDGDGGLGKTMVAMQLAIAVRRGLTDWLGFEVADQGDVVFLSAEEPEPEIHRRAYRISARGKFQLAELEGLHFWFPSDVGGSLLAVQSSRNTIEPTPTFRALADRINEIRPALVVVDNIAAIYGGDQNHRGMVRGFINLWRGLAHSSGAAILLLNHPSLSGLTTGTGRGGSMDWRNAVRSALHLKPAPDQADADRGVRVLECVKNNYAAHGAPVRLEWVDGVLTVEGTASPIQRAAQEAQADNKFLELLAHHIRLGIDVGPSTGQNYAPKIFADAPENGGYTSKGFAVVMHRLLNSNRIVIEEQGPPSKRRKRLVIAGQSGTE